MSFRVPEDMRIQAGHGYVSRPGDLFGHFVVARGEGRVLLCLACDGGDEPGMPREAVGWEHVSVSAYRKGDRRGSVTPTWADMCVVKDLFWGPEDVVVQFHPRASQYIDHGPILHLWRHSAISFPTPPPSLVGVVRKFGAAS